MKISIKVGIIVLAVLLLALPLVAASGCGKKTPSTVVDIVFGSINDLTGPASPATKPVQYALEDVAKYVNENDPIPGVNIKVVAYDCQYNPARDVLGWDFLRGQGAKVIYSPIPTTISTLASFAARDKVPLVIATGSRDTLEPPGWVFSWYPAADQIIKGQMEWLAKQWKGTGKIKIGSAGWDEPYATEIKKGASAYAQAHPDKFQWVGGYLAPFLTMTWSAEIGALKSCDYIIAPTTIPGTTTFMKQARESGFKGKFVSTDAIAGFTSFIVDAVGWADLDGMTASHVTTYWSTESPLTDLATELVRKYHPGEADGIISAGCGYSSVVPYALMYFEILRKAVDKVGVENFTGQAYYDVANNFKSKSIDGYKEAVFTPTSRSAYMYHRVYEWSASAQDLVSRSDWIPIPE